MNMYSEMNTDVQDVYEQYADSLYRIAYSMLLSKEGAEDAVHDVFYKYMVKHRNFKDSEHQKAWFIRVTINQCHDILRHEKIRKTLPLEDARNICSEISASKVMEDILLLDEKFKTAILLYYFEGYDIKEIAQILNISVSAVKMRLSRAREALKEKIKTGEGF